MATPETPGAVRRIARVTYEDGHTETLNLSKPRLYLEATEFLQGIDNPGKGMLVLAWFAAGKPGMNGGPLSEAVAVAKMEAWIDTLEAFDFAEEPIQGPPTKRPKRSRASRASSDGQ